MNNGPELMPARPPAERNWVPLAVAFVVVLVVVGIVFAILEHGKEGPKVTPIAAQADSYAGSLPLTGLAMSESGNLAGGKVTYLDGHIANRGQQTVTAITVQILFRNAAQEVAQNETQQLKIIRTIDPYVDLIPVSAAPLKAGDERDFRLIFDAVVPGWDGAYPQLKIVHVETK